MIVSNTMFPSRRDTAAGRSLFCLDFSRRFFDKKAHEPVSCAGWEIGSTREFGST
jgi:hypothetical protein